MQIKKPSVILAIFFMTALIILIILSNSSLLKSAAVPSGNTLQPPSKEHFFGTDDLGIDIFASICSGAKISLFLAIASALFAAIGGSIIGAFAGYLGGYIDQIFLGIADFFISMPDLLLMIVLSAFLGPGLKSIIIAISLVSWITPAKIIRSEIQKIKTESYVILSKAYGANFIHLFLWHFWRPLFSIMIVSVIKIMNKAILAEASLAYLGLGNPTSRSWGMMISKAMSYPNIYLTEFWKWMLIFPVSITVLTILSISVIGREVEIKILCL